MIYRYLALSTTVIFHRFTPNVNRTCAGFRDAKGPQVISLGAHPLGEAHRDRILPEILERDECGDRVAPSRVDFETRAARNFAAHKIIVIFMY